MASYPAVPPPLPPRSGYYNQNLLANSVVGSTACISLTAFLVGIGIGIGFGALIFNRRYYGWGAGICVGRKRRSASNVPYSLQEEQQYLDSIQTEEDLALGKLIKALQTYEEEGFSEDEKS